MAATIFNNVKANYDVSEVFGNLASVFDVEVDEIKKLVLTDVFKNNDTFKSMICSTLVDKISNSVNPKIYRPRVRIKQILTDRERQNLVNDFPELSFDFIKMSNEPHAFAHAHRIAEYYKCLINASYFGSRAVVKKNSVLVKSVGGNRSFYAASGFEFIHSCEPILDVTDAARCSERDIFLHNFRPKANDVSKLNAKMNYSKKGLYYCDNKSQFCTVKSDVLIFIHSIYDMSITDIADSMSAADAKIAYGTFMFSKDFFLKSEGYLTDLKCSYSIKHKNFSKNMNEIDKISFLKKINNYNICFSFLNDFQPSYVHSYKNLIDFITTPVFYDKKKERCYLKTIVSHSSNICFFKLVLLNVNFVPTCNIISPVSLFSETNSYIVNCYDWLETDMNTKVKFIKLPIAKQTWDSVCSYLANVPDGQFTIVKAQESMKSFSNKVVINGVTVTFSHSLTYDNLTLLAQSAYLYVYIKKYKNSKMFSLILEDIERVRKLSKPKSKNWFFDLLNCLKQKFFSFTSCSNSTSILANFHLVKTKSLYKYPIDVSEAVQPVLLSAHFNKRFSLKYEFMTNYLPEDLFDDLDMDYDSKSDDEKPEDDEEETVSVSSVATTPELQCGNLYDKINYDDTCEESFVVGTAIGDGDCFFHCISQLGVEVGDIYSLRNKVYSNCLSNKNYYTCFDDFADLSIDKNPISVYSCFCVADYLNFDLCIHIFYDGELKFVNTYKNNNSLKCHIRFDVYSPSLIGHFSPMFPEKEKILPLVNFIPDISVEFYDVGLDVDVFLDSKNLKSIRDLHDAFETINDNCFKSNFKNSLDYVYDSTKYILTRDSLKFFEMTNFYNISVDNVLIITDAMQDSLNQLHTLINPIILTFYESDFYYADLNDNTAFSAVYNCLAIKKYKFAYLNLNNPVSRYNKFEEKKFSIINSMLMALYTLDVGGDLIFSIFNLESCNQLCLIKKLSEHFEVVNLFKPSSCHRSSSELFVCCKNLKMAITVNEIADFASFLVVNKKTDDDVSEFLDLMSLSYLHGLRRLMDCVTNAGISYNNKDQSKYVSYYNSLAPKLRAGMTSAEQIVKVVNLFKFENLETLKNYLIHFLDPNDSTFNVIVHFFFSENIKLEDVIGDTYCEYVKSFRNKFLNLFRSLEFEKLKDFFPKWNDIKSYFCKVDICDKFVCTKCGYDFDNSYLDPDNYYTCCKIKVNCGVVITGSIL